MASLCLLLSLVSERLSKIGQHIDYKVSKVMAKSRVSYSLLDSRGDDRIQSTFRTLSCTQAWFLLLHPKWSVWYKGV